MSTGRATVAWLLGLSAALAVVLADAALRRDARDGAHGEARARAQVRASSGADLALSTSSRWLRHPSSSEPAAAFQDSPASLDVDPAAMLVPPARAVLDAASRDRARRAQ